MLDAYDGALPHPRSKSAFQDDRGSFVCVDDAGAGPGPGDCLYRFNSLGYRSEEFDPAARLKIFVAGCSYTFGLGVPYEETWPVLPKKQLAERLGVPPEQANLQNFSQIGASNGYIARTIVRQCDRVRPDLAVIAFTHRQRTEYLAPGVTRNLGLWDLDIQQPGWSAPTVRWLDQYNDDSASLDLLKDMLLVQCAMVRRGIPYLLLWMNRTGLDEAPFKELEPLRHLKEMIDPARFSPRCLLEPEIMVDANPVDRHPGPQSHANFAPLVLEALDLSAPKAIGLPSPPTPRRQLAFAEKASSDRMVRTLLAECRRERPESVLASFSDGRSREHFLGQTLVELDPTSAESLAPELAPELAPKLARLTDAIRDFATDEQCDLNALRNILMAQEFLKMQGVPSILSVPPALGAPGKHPILGAYASLLDPTFLRSRPLPGDKRDDGQAPRRRAGEITLELVQRLKKRFSKSRGEDPNVYPLW